MRMCIHANASTQCSDKIYKLTGFSLAVVSFLHSTFVIHKSLDQLEQKQTN